MLRHQLVSEAQSLIEDPEYWTAARLTVLFNRGMRDLANEQGVTVTGYFISLSVQGQQQYQVPYDFKYYQMIAFDSNGDYNKITLKPRPNAIYSVVSNPTEEGTPSVGFLWAKEDREELWIYPTFDSDDIEMEWFYWRRPPDITNDNDEPLIPRDWHTYLVDYAVNFTLQQDAEKGWSYPVFYSWWQDQKRNVQVSSVIGSGAHDDIRIGVFDDQLPRVTGDALGIITGNDGDVIW